MRPPVLSRREREAAEVFARFADEDSQNVSRQAWYLAHALRKLLAHYDATQARQAIAEGKGVVWHPRQARRRR